MGGGILAEDSLPEAVDPKQPSFPVIPERTFAQGSRLNCQALNADHRRTQLSARTDEWTKFSINSLTETETYCGVMGLSILQCF